MGCCVEGYLKPWDLSPPSDQKNVFGTTSFESLEEERNGRSIRWFSFGLVEAP